MKVILALTILAMIVWDVEGRCCRPRTRCMKIQTSCVSCLFFENHKEHYGFLREECIFRHNLDGPLRKYAMMEGLQEVDIAAMEAVTDLDAGVEVHVGGAEEADLEDLMKMAKLLRLLT